MQSDTILYHIMSLWTISDSDVRLPGYISLMECVPLDVILMGRHPLGNWTIKENDCPKIFLIIVIRIVR